MICNSDIYFNKVFRQRYIPSLRLHTGRTFHPNYPRLSRQTSCILSLSAGGQSDRPKHVAEWNKSERVNVRVLCFMWTGRLRLKCDGTRAETRFVFGRNGRVHLNRQGRQLSRLLAAEVCASAVVMLDTPCSEVVWRVLATHSIRQFPLHFPFSTSPCAITF